MSETETLRTELEDAFRARAHLYRLMLDELTAEIGAQRAEALIARMLERRGREVAAKLFKGIEGDPVAIGKRFLSVSPDSGRMYPNEAEFGDNHCSFRVQRCPLKDAWREWGLDDGRVAALCRLAGAFDKGLFEAAGVTFANQTWTRERGGGCCWIALEPAQSPLRKM